MTFAQLRAFAAVVRLGSVTAAAASLGVSEPAVSSAVGSLRQEFEDPLLIRTAFGLTPTPGGRALAGRAAEILGLAEEAGHAVRTTSAVTD
ncbi:LysR family transcriptional regulator [Egibacter rhizosphaerae]|uniref:LysR family transcriptional regulator n=1 Tax=Egibacter rhizosphaerae TaxID=1670831 RepID=A0A411YC37_9ACTN|nr:LysR family transcriptional regulator [Egibacter rhizosphaerae]QBI18722.1 LysR family transcriptional regulator [Egibacter rhizosphaerae]